jgi:tetratricopeptide (TPR) repeat protein
LLGVAGVRARLDERLRMLTAGSRTVLRRHQTLRELLDWSHGLLAPDDRVVFRRAGIFAGSFSLLAAQTALADERLDEWAVLDHLGNLVDKSLLVAEPTEPPRYHLLETARAYALEKLRDADETEALLEKHARAVLALFEKEYAEHRDSPSQVRIARCRADIDNLRAAFDWAEQSGDETLQIALAGASGWMFGAVGQGVEGVRRCERALRLVSPATPPELEARLCLAFIQRSHPRANIVDLAARDRASELFRQLDDRRGRFDVLRIQTRAEAIAGDLAACERHVKEMEALCEPQWPASARWELLAGRIWLLAYADRMAAAFELCDEALRVAESSGDEHTIVTTLVYSEQGLQALGRFDEAVASGRELRARVRGDPFSWAHEMSTGNLAMALTEVGNLDEAVGLAKEVIPSKLRNGNLWVVLDMYARIALERGRMTDAARILGRADESFTLHGGKRQFNEKRQRAHVHGVLARAIGADELARLMIEGEALTDEEAARLALVD